VGHVSSRVATFGQKSVQHTGGKCSSSQETRSNTMLKSMGPIHSQKTPWKVRGKLNNPFTFEEQVNKQG
jgi:hypothetical protein